MRKYNNRETFTYNILIVTELNGLTPEQVEEIGLWLESKIVRDGNEYEYDLPEFKVYIVNKIYPTLSENGSSIYFDNDCNLIASSDEKQIEIFTFTIEIDKSGFELYKTKTECLPNQTDNDIIYQHIAEYHILGFKNSAIPSFVKKFSFHKGSNEETRTFYNPPSIENKVNSNETEDKSIIGYLNRRKDYIKIQNLTSFFMVLILTLVAVIMRYQDDSLENSLISWLIIALSFSIGFFLSSIDKTRTSKKNKNK